MDEAKLTVILFGDDGERRENNVRQGEKGKWACNAAHSLLLVKLVLDRGGIIRNGLVVLIACLGWVRFQS